MAKLWVFPGYSFCWKACNSSLCCVKWRTSFPTSPISLITLQIEGTLHTTWPRNWPCCPSIGYTDSCLEITFVFQNQSISPPGSLGGLLSNWWCPSFSSQCAGTLFILSSVVSPQAQTHCLALLGSMNFVERMNPQDSFKFLFLQETNYSLSPDADLPCNS